MFVCIASAHRFYKQSTPQPQALVYKPCSAVRLMFFTWSNVQKYISTNQIQCWLFSHHTHVQHLLALINITNTYLNQADTPFIYLCFSFCSSSSTLFSLQCSTLGITGNHHWQRHSLDWKADQNLQKNMSKSHDYERHACDIWLMGQRHLLTSLPRG